MLRHIFEFQLLEHIAHPAFTETFPGQDINTARTEK